MYHADSVKSVVNNTNNWPERLYEATAFHEAGHALTTVHSGRLLIFLWVGDGLDRAQRAGIDVPRMASAKHVEDGVRGLVLSGSSTTIFDSYDIKPEDQDAEHGLPIMSIYKDLQAAKDAFLNNKDVELADIVSADPPFDLNAGYALAQTQAASTFSEMLAPHYSEFRNLHKVYPELFENSSNFLLGSQNDMVKSMELLMSWYKDIGVPSPLLGAKMFIKDVLLPTVKIVRLYELQIRALAKELMNVHYCTGKHAHEIICQTSHGNSLLGCSETGKLNSKVVRELKSSLDGLKMMPT